MTGAQASVGGVAIGTPVGQRQLTGLAAGSAATDAVNVSQLIAVRERADLLGTSTATALGGGAGYDVTTGAVTAPAYVVQGTARGDVGSALTALDDQTTANTAAIATNTTDIAAASASITTLSTDIDNGTIGLVRQSTRGADLTVGTATDGTTVNFSGTAGNRLLTGVGAGTISATSADAINGSQLSGTIQSFATALGGGSSVAADGSIVAPAYLVQGAARTDVGSALTALDAQVTNNTIGNATNAGAITDLATGIGNGTLGLVRQAAPTSALTVGAATGGTAVSFAGTSGARRLTDIAGGTISASSTDAVNGSQLFAGNTSLARTLGGGATINQDGTVAGPTYRVQGVTTDNVGDALTLVDGQVTTNTANITNLAGAIGAGTVGLVRQSDPAGVVTVASMTGGTLVSFAGSGGNRSLTGVANGVVARGSTEAVNGDQLAGTMQSLASALGGGATVTATGAVTAPAYTVQGTTQASMGGAITAIDAQVTSNTTAIAGLSSDVAGLGSAINAGTVGLVKQGPPGAGLTVGTATDGTTVDFAGTAGNRALTGVAAGMVSAASSDAVNGSQLAATNLAVRNVADLVTSRGVGAFVANNSAVAAIPVASGIEASAGGNGAIASGQQTVAVGNNAVASGPRSTALGYAARATGTNSVALGSGSTDGGESNVVSVGASGAERRITNVGVGINQTDAVNVGQLNSSIGRTLASANAYTDRRVEGLTYDIREVRHDGEGATAASMALAGIPQSFEPGMGMVGVGVGTWQGESAVALGVSKAADDGRVVFKAGATYNSRGQGGANGGMGLAF